MKGVFITGSDTGVGKTLIACAYASRLAAEGITVSPRKPVASGNSEPSDARLLHRAAKSNEPLDKINLHAFAEPVSPARAARKLNIHMDINKLADFCLTGKDNFLIVEGAGGLLSPLADGISNADLAARLALPLIIVSEYRLGCINQVLLTMEAARSRGFRIEAVYLSQKQQRGPEDFTDLREIAGEVVKLMPVIAGGDYLKAAEFL